MTTSSIVWFRQDLRLADNPALQEAINSGSAVIPVFIWSPNEEKEWRPGPASRWWLEQSLKSLDDSLCRLGSKLIIRKGNSLEILQELVKETNAQAVFWNRRYEPVIIERDTRIRSSLVESGCRAESFNSALLFEPWKLKTKMGGPYKVFTPFWKAALALNRIESPLCAPEVIPCAKSWPKSMHVEELELNSRAKDFSRYCQPGENKALDRLNHFLTQSLLDYPEARDIPGRDGVSRLSSYLHFGEIGPRQIWHRVNAFASEQSMPGIFRSAECYLRELIWREFAYHLLFHFPQTTNHPLRSEFSNMRCSSDNKTLDAWKTGRTGYPLVDAGLRELLATGWMHNRVRMVVASLLVKDLLLPWQEGAKWFWDTLVDADLANNTLGWQWSAGCGADAAPYFRIFNPTSQGEKCDPQGQYTRKWLPELSNLPDKWIHKPWQAPSSVLTDSGIEIGFTCPEPIIDHSEARARALQAFAQMQKDK